MQVLNLKVHGMTCAGCAKSVEAAVGQLGASCAVDLAHARATVTVEQQTSAQIIEAIENAGFDCELI